MPTLPDVGGGPHARPRRAQSGWPDAARDTRPRCLGGVGGRPRCWVRGLGRGHCEGGRRAVPGRRRPRLGDRRGPRVAGYRPEQHRAGGCGRILRRDTTRLCPECDESSASWWSWSWRWAAHRTAARPPPPGRTHPVGRAGDLAATRAGTDDDHAAAGSAEPGAPDAPGQDHPRDHVAQVGGGIGQRPPRRPEHDVPALHHRVRPVLPAGQDHSDRVDLQALGGPAADGPVRGAPVEAAFSPDARYAYVSNAATAPSGGRSPCPLM
jgi:hypothetical protein